MKEETYEGPEAEEGSEGTGKAPGRDQPESVIEPHKGQEEPDKRMQQVWEAHLQKSAKTLQAPHSARGSPQLPEASTWDDAKAFLASFEQVAEACHWPREEWVARLLPALNEVTQQAFSLLAARDQEDYGQVKAAILRGEALRREMQRQHFRQFCCPQIGDPRGMYSQVQELCCQWLKPERHSKEQILELLILEQFLAGLPGDVQSRIRACGPDSGDQAVALLEQFLLSQTEAKTGTWQDPLQEWAVGLLDAKEEPLDMVQGEIFKEHAEIFRDTNQNITEEVALLGIGITRPTSLLPPEGQDMDEIQLRKVLGIQVEKVMNPSKSGGTLHMVEQTPMQSNQQTMFWKVLPEEDQNVDNMGTRVGLAPHPVKKEETFLPDTVQSLHLPGRESDNGKRIQFTVKNYQLGGNELEETSRIGQERIQENMLVTVEMKEERCESSSKQGMELYTGCKESGELTRGLGATRSDPSPMDTEQGKASFSKYDRRFRQLSPDHTGEVCNEGPLLEEKTPLKSKLGEHHNNHMEEKNPNCPEFRVTLHSNSLAKYQIIQAGEKPYKCPVCAKSFSKSSDLLQHQIHAGRKPHQCPQCGKRFSKNSDLLRHEMIHTGEKPHKCSVCRRGFSQKSVLLRHEKTHTGEKPYKCLDCGKGFLRWSDLSSHQKVHIEGILKGVLSVDKA